MVHRDRRRGFHHRSRRETCPPDDPTFSQRCGGASTPTFVRPYPARMAAPHQWQYAFIASASDRFLCVGRVGSGNGRETFGRQPKPGMRALDSSFVSLRVSLWPGCRLVFLLFLSDFSGHTLLLEFPKQEHPSQLAMAGPFLSMSRLFELFWLGIAGLPCIGLCCQKYEPRRDLVAAIPSHRRSPVDCLCSGIRSVRERTASRPSCRLPSTQCRGEWSLQFVLPVCERIGCSLVLGCRRQCRPRDGRLSDSHTPRHLLACEALTPVFLRALLHHDGIGYHPAKAGNADQRLGYPTRRCSSRHSPKTIPTPDDCGVSCRDCYNRLARDSLQKFVRCSSLD